MPIKTSLKTCMFNNNDIIVCYPHSEHSLRTRWMLSLIEENIYGFSRGCFPGIPELRDFYDFKYFRMYTTEYDSD